MHDGFTARCEECKAAMRGMRGALARPLSEGCRQRMEALMKDALKMLEADKRLGEFLDKVGRADE